MKKKIFQTLFFYHSRALFLSQFIVSLSYCTTIHSPPSLIDPNSITSAEIVNIDSYLNRKPDLSDKPNIFSNIIIEHNLWGDNEQKSNQLNSGIKRENTELEPVVSRSENENATSPNAPLWEKNLILSSDPNKESQKSNSNASSKKGSSNQVTEDSLIRPKQGNEKPRILEGGIIETTPIQYSLKQNYFYFVKISIQKNIHLKDKISDIYPPFIRYISQTSTNTTTNNSNASQNTTNEQPQGEVVITTSGKKFFVPFAPNSTPQAPSSGTITPGTTDNQYVFNNSGSLPQSTKDYAPRSFSEQAKEKGLNYPDTNLVNTNSPAFKAQNTPPQKSPLPEGIKISKSAEKSSFALDEEQVLRMQSQIKFENLRIESTLLAMEKEELQRKLAEQLVKQLQAQKKSEKQKGIQIEELRQLIKEVMSENVVSSEGKEGKTTKFSMSKFNLKSKNGAKKAAKECSGKSQEECSERSEMCTYKKFKVKGKEKSRCRIKCALIPKKICKSVKVCTTNKKGGCKNKP